MSITINVSGLKAYGAKARAAIQEKVMPQIGRRYLAFCYKRAKDEGRGDWAPLAKRTLDDRKKRGNSSQTILRDTGRLVGALRPGAAGNEFVHAGKSVTVGFSSAPHRGADGSVQPFSDLARSHNLGMPQAHNENIPQRNMLPEPNLETITLMQQDAVKILSSI